VIQAAAENWQVLCNFHTQGVAGQGMSLRLFLKSTNVAEMLIWMLPLSPFLCVMACKDDIANTCDSVVDIVPSRIHTHTHIYTHICVCVYIPLHMLIYVYVWVHVFTYMYVCVYMCLFNHYNNSMIILPISLYREIKDLAQKQEGGRARIET
jgi:hypothetical protein